MQAKPRDLKSAPGSQSLERGLDVLEIVGAASVTIGPALSENPTEAFTGELASPLAKATLLAIAIGAIAANSINIYSGAMAFVTIGI